MGNNMGNKRERQNGLAGYRPTSNQDDPDNMRNEEAKWENIGLGQPLTDTTCLTRKTAK